MTPDTEKLVLDALRRVVRQAFNPPTKRHRRSGWAGSPCDIAYKVIDPNNGEVVNVQDIRDELLFKEMR